MSESVKKSTTARTLRNFLKFIWIACAHPLGMMAGLVSLFAIEGRGLGVQKGTGGFRFWIARSGYPSLVLQVVVGDLPRNPKAGRYMGDSGMREYPATATYSAEFILLVPCWVVATALFGTSWAIRHFSSRSNTPPPNTCENCGYDLRAHNLGEKCPECGTLISESPESRHAK